GWRRLAPEAAGRSAGMRREDAQDGAESKRAGRRAGRRQGGSEVACMTGDKPGQQPYHRTTSLEFLDRCSPKIASFYRLWESKLRGRRMPARSDFDPLEMKEWLPGIVLVDVEHNPLRLTYRLVGTRSVTLKQRDVTGQRVEEGYHGSSLEEILENYNQVIRGRSVGYDWEGAGPARRPPPNH